MSLVNTRIFVEKKPLYQLEAQVLLNEIESQLNIPISSLRYLNIYDVFDIEESLLERAITTVFSEVMVDNVLETVESATNEKMIAWEYLPGQYDQRADSAKQCILLLDPTSNCVVKSGTCILIEGDVNLSQLQTITNYCINPIEAQLKDISRLTPDVDVSVSEMEDLAGFTVLTAKQLESFRTNHGLAMSFADLQFVQEYFKTTEGRDPSETELKVLDTYWSDHCRHTTFETCLSSITIEKSKFSAQIQQAYDNYLVKRKSCGREDRPQTLMDLATIESRYLRSIGKHTDVEVSEEINACSVYIDVDVDGVIEKWLLMFKNETHNHPTEIEPFGGASTCIGGAIRDPLSGRSYVYQAMRISGCADITRPLDETIEGKLPQRIISKKAAQGNSSYGNQIGLATTFVKEIYHPNYSAKHLELGAVVGAVKADYIRREPLTTGDVIILLGGDTGRDGIGGATGSSKEHNLTSLASCAAEVQKGNAPEERKIQRLFRNPKVTRLVKKCNDFGAGGVCVAIGELADGLHIELEKVRLKYAGLNATEIAISESQERMAVGVSINDANEFIKLATEENLRAYVVATVTDNNRLRMTLNGIEVVNISRDFINTSGVRQSVVAVIDGYADDTVYQRKEVSKENILTMLGDLNCACQKGLVEMFDSTVGSSTVLMPYGGQYQLTPSQVSVQKLPVLNGKTETCSILAYGYEADAMSSSPFIGTMHSVLASISKTIASGGYLDRIHFSFQEYFKRLQEDSKRWGDVAQALLGANVVQSYFEKGAIGGKDSMSGTFNDIDVPNTLVSFACSTTNVNRVISSEFKQAGNHIYLYEPIIDEFGYPDLQTFKEVYSSLETEIGRKNIISSHVVETGGWVESCLKMSFGNNLGFACADETGCLDYRPGTIVVESINEIDHPFARKIGRVALNGYVIGAINISFEEAYASWTSTLSSVYPLYANGDETKPIDNISYNKKSTHKSKFPVDVVKVVIPAFPGTNCEYDVCRAFEKEGAVCEIVVFKNQSEQQILSSIMQLANSIETCQIFAIPGGFSSGDEPDGSAKFIVNVLQNETIKNAITDLLARDGLILGICNGFQALVKSGLLPYGEVRALNDTDATLYRNSISRHVSTMATTRVASTLSPWLNSFECGENHVIAMSHGEGRFVASADVINELVANGQIAFQFADEFGNATMDVANNINGSALAIEGITSIDGHILGKMGHSERYSDGLFKNIYGNKVQNIFRNGVDFFRK